MDIAWAGKSEVAADFTQIQLVFLELNVLV